MSLMELRTIGESLYGTGWQSKLARWLKRDDGSTVNPRTVRRWAAGDSDVPVTVAELLRMRLTRDQQRGKDSHMKKPTSEGVSQEDIRLIVQMSADHPTESLNLGKRTYQQGGVYQVCDEMFQELMATGNAIHLDPQRYRGGITAICTWYDGVSSPLYKSLAA